MYVHSYGLEHLIPGEPAPEAIHREEFYAGQRHDDQPREIAEPGLRQRALLLRAQVVAGVGSFFA